MNIQQQIAIVTGGASGMGKACALALRQRGAQVMVWDLETHDVPFENVRCDVRSSDSVEAALEKTIQRFGVPNICIQCAGIAPAQRMVGKTGPMPLAAFQDVIDINLVGTFNVMRVVTHAMMALPCNEGSEERGVVVNTASIAAFEGQIGQTAYSASKAGVVAMTLPAARELAAFAIRVNTIAPGLIATPLFSHLPELAQETLAASVPFPKRLGRPEEFAALAMHMIENTLLNGEVIRLDGALRLAPQ